MPLTGMRGTLGPPAWMYAAVFTVYGLHIPYLSVWLESRQISPAAIGIIMAVPLIVRLVATPAIAVISDTTGRHGTVILQLALVGLCATAALGLVSGPLLIGAGVLVMLVAVQSMMPLIEVVALDAAREGKRDYGQQRLFGSLTFILATMLGGSAIEAFGGGIVQPLAVLAMGATVLAAFALPRARAPGMVRRGDGEANIGVENEPAFWPALLARVEGMIALRQIPGLVVILIAAGLIQASHAVYYTFSAVHWRSLGFSGTWIGILWSLGVVAEIVLFARSGFVHKRIGAIGLLQLGAVAALARWAAMALDPGPFLAVPLQLLHGLTFGATHLAAVFYIGEVVPRAQAGTAQALGATFATGIAMGVGTFIAGQLYADWKALSYLAMAAPAVAVLAGLWLFRGRWDAT